MVYISGWVWSGEVAEPIGSGVKADHEVMVSFDVVSLFTKVPVEDSLTLLSQHFNKDILAQYKHVLTSTYLCVDGQFYEQTGGVAMGSPLSPVIANFCMEDFETKAKK